MAKIVDNSLRISCCKCPITASITAKILDNGATVELTLPEGWSSSERPNLWRNLNVHFRCADCTSRNVLEEPCGG